MNVNQLTSGPKLSRILGEICIYKRSTHSAIAASEYAEAAEYPPILDMSKKGKRQRKKEVWYEKITKLPTVEQKFMELNMPKYYGYWSCQLHDTWRTMNGLPFVKYATRTHTVNTLPDNYYSEVKSDAEKVAYDIKDQVEALIDLNFNTTLNRRNSNKDIATESFFLGLHKIVNGVLSSSIDHIKDSVVDVKPRVEAFWILGGMQPDKLLQKIRKGHPATEEEENDLTERSMQGRSTPTLGVRVNLSLPEVVPLDHPMSTSAAVPVENLDPRAYGFRFKHKHATITTGYWPGETKEHCQLWLHSNGFLDKVGNHLRDKYTDDYVHSKMIVSSFTQALAHASYLGFGPVTELTYPIVHQSVLSDGQKWNFSVYQLNTCALHSERAIENPQNNILWLNDEQQLFEAVDDTGIKGFNSDVLATLVAMYMKKGIDRENATPYLAPYKYLAYHPAPEEYRQDFQKYLQQHIFSGRPRHLKKPEMYLWEKIYKVDFKTRPYEPPRKFYEKHFAQRHPDKRRLDDYSPIYVPKPVRADKKIKFKPKLNSEYLFKYDKTI